MNLSTLFITGFLMTQAMGQQANYVVATCIGLRIEVTRRIDNGRITMEEAIRETLTEEEIYAAELAYLDDFNSCKVIIPVMLVIDGKVIRKMTFEELRAMLAPKVKAEEP